MTASSSASPERNDRGETTGRGVTSVVEIRYDTKVRGRIALLVTGCFLGFPGIFIILFVLGIISAGDLENILQQILLYLGPVFGVILGYYFRDR